MWEPVAFPWTFALVVLGYSYWKQRKIRASAESAISSLFGYYMVILGARMTPYTLGPICELTREAFGVNGGIMNSEVFGALLLDKCGETGFLVFFLGFAVNLLLARCLKAKGMYLTGHHFLYMSLFASYALSAFLSLPPVATVIVGAVLVGAWSWGTVSVTSLAVRRVTGSRDTGMANSCAGASLIGAAAGKLLGNADDRYDGEPVDGNIPVMAFLGTLTVWVILIFTVGTTRAGEILGSESPWYMSCLVSSLLYGAQVTVLVHGIRLMVSSVVMLFWDMASKAVPGLWAGLDASALISYSPRAWQAGFLGGLVGGVFVMALLAFSKASFIPIVSLTSFYYVGGVAGVCGNVYGGKRGAWAASILTGVASVLLIALMMSFTNEITRTGAVFGETEYGLFGLAIRLLCGAF